MPLGLSFIPPTDQQRQQQPGQQGAPPVQQALQMLSLRVPRFGGINAIAPDQLTHGRQAGTPLPGTPEWEELMRRLMGGMPGQQSQGQPPNNPPTNPNVVYQPPPVGGGQVEPIIPPFQSGGPSDPNAPMGSGPGLAPGVPTRRY